MKVCKATSRATMCDAVRKETDSRLEEMAKLVAAFGTGSKYDLKTKRDLNARLSVLNREVREMAPNYYKLIRQND